MDGTPGDNARREPVVGHDPGVEPLGAGVTLLHEVRSPTNGHARRYQLSVKPEGWGCEPPRAELFGGVARFLCDAAGAWLRSPELARLLGAAFFAFAPGVGRAMVSLRADEAQAHAWLVRPSFGVENNHFGRVDILYEDETLGLYILAVAPGRCIPPHFHRVMAESELVLDPGLLQQGRSVPPGAAFHWPKGFVHEYRNPTQHERRILCLDRPRFMPEDEVEATGAVELLPLAPAANYFA